MTKNNKSRLNYNRRTDRIFSTEGVPFKRVENPTLNITSMLAVSKGSAAIRETVNESKDSYIPKFLMVSTKTSGRHKTSTTKEVLDFINVNELLNKGYEVYVAQKGPKYLFALLDPNSEEDFYLYTLSPMKRGRK